LALEVLDELRALECSEGALDRRGVTGIAARLRGLAGSFLPDGPALLLFARDHARRSAAGELEPCDVGAHRAQEELVEEQPPRTCEQRAVARFDLPDVRVAAALAEPGQLLDP